MGKENTTKYQTLAIQLVKAFLSHRNVFIAILMATLIVTFAALAISSPNIEWDILPYLANATQQAFNIESIEQLHTDVYRTAQSSLQPAAFDKLVDSTMRIAWHQDHEEFHQMMHFFYDTRIVYIGILSLLLKTGLNPIASILYFSVACSIGSILILSRLVPVKVPLGLYFALPFIILSFGVLDVARLATPDAFATLTTISLYALLLRNKIGLLLILLPLVVFVRTDLILLVGLFLAYFFFLRNVSKLAAVLSGVATLGAYYLINAYLVDADPWSSLIGFNYAEEHAYRTGYVYDVTFYIYLDYIKRGVLSFSYNPIGIVFLGLAVTGITTYISQFFVGTSNYRTSQLHCDLLFLLISCVIYLFAHFLLFPVTWTRFFAAQYSLVAVVVVWTTLAILAERNYSTDRNHHNLLG